MHLPGHTMHELPWTATVTLILCADVTQQANDEQQLVPMLEQREDHLGKIPDRVLADARYFTEEAVDSGVEGFAEHFVPREPKKHSYPPEPALVAIFLTRPLSLTEHCATSGRERGDRPAPSEKRLWKRFSDKSKR